jgi:NADP-dependent 3-hydroxy acid dehydrogenase YdfG
MLIWEIESEATALVTDVSDRQAVTQMAEQVVQQLGPVDILIQVRHAGDSVEF